LPLAAQVNASRAAGGRSRSGRRTQAGKVDVRIISATNRKARPRKAAFREDLFYRLHVLPLTIRRCGRGETFASAAFLARFAPKETAHHRHQRRGWAYRAVEWPGNIRQR
jgi:transcriptional regulator with PAS, ATPase and Fis domain